MLVTTQWPLKRAATSPHLSGFVFYGCLESLTELSALWKNNRAPPLSHIKLCIISSPYVNSKWSYCPETAKLGFDLCDLDLWSLTLAFCMDIIFVIGNDSLNFHDDTMTGILWKRCNRRTDRLTDRQMDGRAVGRSVLRAAWSQLKKSPVWYEDS